MSEHAISTQFIFMVCLVLASAYASPLAFAEPVPKIFLPIGINTGVALDNESTRGGGFFGAEISFATFLNDMTPLWYGVYVDVVHVFSTPSLTRFSVGPEVGYEFLGFDGGYVIELQDDKKYQSQSATKSLPSETHHGIQGRFLIYYVFGGVFFRGGILWDDQSDARPYGEIGLLLKLPFVLSE